MSPAADAGPFFVELAALPGPPAPGRVGHALETAGLFATHPRLGFAALRIAHLGVPGVSLTAALRALLELTVRVAGRLDGLSVATTSPHRTAGVGLRGP